MPSGMPKTSPMAASRLACVTIDQPGLPPGQAERAQHGQFVAAAADRDGQGVPDGPDGQHGEEGAQRQRQHGHVLDRLDEQRQTAGLEGKRLPALDALAALAVSRCATAWASAPGRRATAASGT